ncbi:MAG: co-chaperone DjlA [Thiohalomonadales bacterium]
MSWWGKLLGGSFGFMIGGPLGALIGAAFGHNFDRGLDSMAAGLGTINRGDPERVQLAFFTATFATMGHIAKADGRVSEAEIKMAQHIMTQLNLSADKQALAIGLFDQGKQDDFNLDDTLEQFKQECLRRSNLIQMFIEIQIATSLADGVIHAEERNILYHIGDRLGFGSEIMRQLIDMVVAQTQYAGARSGTRQAQGPSLDEAYSVLGVERSVADSDIKKAYRRLMNQHHPDKLVSKGLPEEMMQLATEKTTEIKLAYEQIKKTRGM